VVAGGERIVAVGGEEAEERGEIGWSARRSNRKCVNRFEELTNGDRPQTLPAHLSPSSLDSASSGDAKIQVGT